MSGGNIKVVVRVRPFNSREIGRSAKCIVNMNKEQTVLTPPPDAPKTGKNADHGKKTFAFDKSYWSFNKDDKHYAGQDNLFNDLGVPLLDNAFKGYNNCIFAYGQTGSGKSYSMMGYGPETGIIPRICQQMFERIESVGKDSALSCTVEVSYIEIYNEKVRDLLNPSNKGNLRVREHPSTGPYVEDLAKLVVGSFKEIENLMDEGNKARTVAATNMNETSSRSHAVFTLTLTQKRHDAETSMDSEKVAKISLVDLAGSERANSTGATGARLKEGAEINRSLSTLGRVIAALADLSSGKKKNASMVPYRDSVLTWLLKDSLGGNSMTAMIAAISPADINFDETLSTLRYADSAKRIKNHAVVNEDPNARMIRELKEELAQLRAKLGGGALPAGGAAPGIPQEEYPPGTPLDQQFVSIVQADGSLKKVSKAEIAEQLSQSEKLYEDLNQTWEEKLLKTQEIHKEREAALEELGISIEKGFVGMSTPKKMPHLVNLSDDPLLAECLVYNLKPGITKVGNEESGSESEIKLNGSKILKEHCSFENSDSTVTITPFEGAAIMVNGIRIDKPMRLRSGNRIILGDFHIFRFNHPQEAKAERAEHTGGSLLRHSVTASQLGSLSPRHGRSSSKAGSEYDADSRSSSPYPGTGQDADWSFARREAAVAILGVDQKINHLTDEELDSLFDDIQRARALRRGRPESRLNGQDDDETESVSSGQIREKYMSNGTMDNFSLDTALTIPSTPRMEGEDGKQSRDDRLQQLRDTMQTQLEKQKEEYQEQLKAAESTTTDLENLKSEKQRMEEDLQAAKVEMQAQLKLQKEEFEKELQEMFEAEQKRIDKNGMRLLTRQEKQVALGVVEKWSQLKNLAMAEVVLRNAALLKEAQVMSQLMDKAVFFQFTIVDQGQDRSSSYDLVLNGIADEESDDTLHATVKPCAAIRVVDYNHSVVHLWSLEKLESRVAAMRKMHQYHDRPDYMQHFHLENPFIESFLPQYSLIGDAQIPLTAVFEARVQDYAVDVISPYTHQSLGIVKISLEPSAAHAPASMLKFNVVMHQLVGFAEREGTEVHAQMYVPGVSEEEGGGASTTQMIKSFDEGAIRFESVHSMSIPQDSPLKSYIEISLFARVSSMHLDKLLSWDEVREMAEQPPRTRKRVQKRSRLPESEYYQAEQHDVFAKVQILEMAETGEYLAVEVEQTSGIDGGTYQLHQGLQRRIAITLTHSSADPLEWETIASMRIGHVRLVDPWGKSPDLDNKTPDVPLKFVSPPNVTQEAGGTATKMTAIAQWDSSLHGAVLLDRPTAEKYSVCVTLTVDASCRRSSSLLSFPMDQTLQIRPRTWIRGAQSTSMFLLRTLWKPASRIIRSTTALYSIELNPAPSKRATDLWRLDSRHRYVKGEEELGNWMPRGVSLIKDFVDAQRRRRRITEVEATRASLARIAPESPLATREEDEPEDSALMTASMTGLGDGLNEERELAPEQKTLLLKTIELWKKPRPYLPMPATNSDQNGTGNKGGTPQASRSSSAQPAARLGRDKLPRSAAHALDPPTHLATPPLSPPPNSRRPSQRDTKLAASVAFVPRNPTVLRKGLLLIPAPALDPAYGGWVRRYAELRPPYLHLYAPAEGAGGGPGGGGGSGAGTPTGASLAEGAGEECAVLNLRNATVDAEPEVGRMLAKQSQQLVRSGGVGLPAGANNVFAVYTNGGSWLFAAREERSKREWIWAVDRAFMAGGGVGGDDTDGEEYE